MRVVLLTKERDAEYGQFLATDEHALAYSSIHYRRLLEAMTNAEPRYLAALDDSGRIVGVLPAFLKRNSSFGNVLNSLPFFGSNGGIVTRRNCGQIGDTLLDAFVALGREESCTSATVVASPLAPHSECYEKNLPQALRDMRIGQITELPEPGADLPRRLMTLFDASGRRNIRKAERSGIEVIRAETAEGMSFLRKVHEDNMNAIGGTAKPASFFDAIPRVLDAGTAFRVYLGLKEGAPVAGVLLLYFNRTVEYFVPVIVQEFRGLQPLSMALFRAMTDAAESGYRWWNWGGTWTTQQGVYRFKRKWGARECPYLYYTVVYDRGILSCSRETLLQEFPHFYVVPFSELTSEPQVEKFPERSDD